MEAKTMGKVNASPDQSKGALKLAALIVGEVAVLLCLFLCVKMCAPGLKATLWFHDPVSEFAAYGVPLVMLLAAGLLPEFFQSFAYIVRKAEEVNAAQLKKSLLAVKLAMVTAVVAQLFVTICGFVSLLESAYGEMEMALSAGFALLGGISIHGVVVVMILLPVYARLKARLIAME